MSVKVNAKRIKQQTVKFFKQNKGKLMWFGRIFAVLTLLLSHWANKIFDSNPHSWFDITGRTDVLLLSLALTLSLINCLFVKLTLAFIDLYIGKMSTFKKLCTIGGILFPFPFLVYSLWVRPGLYTVPIVTVLLVYFYMHYKSRVGKHVV